jgi:hypothetical protein
MASTAVGIVVIHWHSARRADRLTAFGAKAVFQKERDLTAGAAPSEGIAISNNGLNWMRLLILIELGTTTGTDGGTGLHR